MQHRESKPSNVTEVTLEELRLNTFKGFNDRFDKHLRQCKTQLEAYILTEQDHYKVFRCEKYSGYESFRQCRNRKFKMNR